MTLTVIILNGICLIRASANSYYATIINNQGEFFVKKKEYSFLQIDIVRFGEDIIVTSPTLNDFDNDNLEWDIFN